MISNLLRCATGADGCTQDLSLIGGFSVEKLCLGHTAISANIFGTSSNRARTSQTDQVLTPANITGLYGVDVDVQFHVRAGHLTVVPIGRPN